MPDLRVSIGGRVSSSLGGALQQARQQFADFAGGVDDTTRNLSGMSVGEIILDHLKEKFAEVALGPVASFVVGLGAVNVALSLMDKATEQAAEGLERFRKVEDIQATFEPLLGGATQARQRLAELAEFAADTPFELPEVAAASKTLEVLTRGALSTGEGLRLVGDVAASSGASFQEIAMWVGRLYDNLQSGRPIGEAMMRLQELGTVSGATRARIEEMQKAGAAGNEVWKVAKLELDRTKGSMEVLSQTITGLRSTLEDAKSALYRAFAASMVDEEKRSVQGATDAIEAMTPVAEHLGNVLADLSVPDAPSDWVGMFDSSLKSAITSVARAKEVINPLITIVAALTTGFLGFSAAAGAVTFTGFVASGKGMIATLTHALLETAKYPFEVRKMIAAEVAQVASGSAVTASMRARAAATVFAGEAVKGFTATLGAARGAVVAFATSPFGWIATAAAGLYLLYQQAERAQKKLQELAEENAMYTKKAFTATDGIETTTDRLNKLAAAYADVKQAREALAKAPPGSVEEEFRKQNLVNAQVTVRKLESMNPRDLKPGDDLKAAQEATKKTSMETYEKGLDATQKLELAQARYNEQLRVQRDLEEKAGKAKFAATGQKLAELSKEEEARRAAYEAAQAADEAEERRLRANVGAAPLPGVAALPAASADTIAKADEIAERRKWRKDTEGKKIEEMTARRQALAADAEGSGLVAEKSRGKTAEAWQDMIEAKRGKYDADVLQKELEARTQIAQVQEEGAGRAYREYVIQQDLTRQKWELAKAAGYQKDQEQAKLEYIERQAKAESEWEKERRSNEQRDRDTQDAKNQRQDALQTRAIDRAEGLGKISGKDADELRARLLEEQQRRALADADRLAAEAREARSHQDEATADQKDRAEIERRKTADALGFQIEDLRNPLPQKQSAVVDSLQRVAGGGGVFLGGTKNPLEAKADRQIKATEEVAATLKRMEDKRPGSTFQ